MTNEVLLSTVEYKGQDAVNADFWKGERYHEDEVTPEMLNNGKQWWRYHLKFDGLKPIQITKRKKV